MYFFIKIISSLCEILWASMKAIQINNIFNYEINLKNKIFHYIENILTINKGI